MEQKNEVEDDDKIDDEWIDLAADLDNTGLEFDIVNLNKDKRQNKKDELKESYIK